MFKKIIAVICTITLLFACSATVLAGPSTVGIKPAVWLSQPVWENVELNGTTAYILVTSGADEINITPADIVLNGFAANVSIHSFGPNKRLILLSDIVGHIGEKNISIKEGIAKKNDSLSYPIYTSIPFYLEGLTWYLKGPNECKVGDLIEFEITSDCVFDWIPSENDFLNLIDSALEFEKVTVTGSKCSIQAKAKSVGAISLIFTNGGYNSNSHLLKINSAE